MPVTQPLHKKDLSFEQAAQAVNELCSTQQLFAFSGNMGAGKTTLIKRICELLHVSDVVTSPTFSIINEYKTTDYKTIYHFDFYRIKSEQEAFDLGYEEYFYSGNICFIEWPEKISTLLPANAIHVSIAVNDEERKITLTT